MSKGAVYSRLLVKQKVGKVERGQWVDYVFNFKYSYTNGFMEVWKDGKSAYSMTGSTITHSLIRPLKNEAFPYLNVTLYKANWFNGFSNPLITERTVYHDEIRIATGSNGYDLVAPRGSPTGESPPVDSPTASPISQATWTLLFADSEEIGTKYLSIIILTFSCLFSGLLRCCCDHIAHYVHFAAP